MQIIQNLVEERDGVDVMIEFQQTLVLEESNAKSFPFSPFKSHLLPIMMETALVEVDWEAAEYSISLNCQRAAAGLCWHAVNLSTTVEF